LRGFVEYNSKMSKELGEMIAKARRDAKKTLRNVATAADISPSLLSLIENGKHMPPKEVIVRLAKELDGNVDFWCGAAGMIAPDAERRLAKLAKEEPALFRSMVNRFGA
jgi:transcriptional regulator with XRE-family HTH domain